MYFIAVIILVHYVESIISHLNNKISGNNSSV